MMAWLKEHRRLIGIVVLVAALFFMIGFFRRYHVPKIKQYILLEIEKYSHRHSPVRVWPERMDFNLFPIGVSFYDVRLLPQGELAASLAATTLEEAQVDISFWALIRGQLRLSRVALRGGGITYIEKSAPKNRTQLAFDFDMLRIVPLDSVALENVQVTARIAAGDLAVQIADLDLEVENQVQALQFLIAGRGLKIKKSGEGPVFDANLSADFLFDREGLYVTQFQMEREKSYLIGTGAFTGKILEGQIQTAKSKLKTRVDLDEAYMLMREFFPQNKVPLAAGNVEIETDFSYTKGQPLSAAVVVEGRKLVVDGYEIGDVKTSGKINQRSVVLGKTTVDHPAGHVTAEQVTLQTDGSKIAARIQPKDLELSRFLAGLKVKNVPVFTKITGDLKCQGQLTSPWKLQCDGELGAPDLLVTSNMTKKTEIVHTKEFFAKGHVVVDGKAVTYDAALTIGAASKGKSKGTISYQDGFNIHYDATQLDFADVVNLAGVQPKGKSQLNGRTWGTSKFARIDLKSKGQDLSLYGYPLGNTEFHMKYNAGALTFQDIRGHLNQSRYQGRVDVDLGKDRLTVEATAPFVDAMDLEPFLNRLNIHIPVTGTGSGTVKYSSPFDRSRVRLNVDAALFRGTIFDETYDQAVAKLVTQDGQMVAQDVSLRKGRSLLRMTGHMEQDGALKLVVAGRGFRLEQSENLSRLKLNVGGQLDVDATIGGKLSRPLFDLTGKLTGMAVGDEPAKSSEFHLRLDESRWQASGRMIGDVVSASVSWPRDAKGELIGQLQATQWNFAQAFSIFSEGLRKEAYNASLTGKVDIAIPLHDPTRARIDGRIENIAVQNSRSSLKSVAPMRFQVDQGRITADQVRLQGEDSFIRVTTGPASPYELNVNFDGKMDMALLRLLTPFLDELRGQLSFTVQARGPFKKPRFLGSASIRDSLIKLRQFPHAFEDLNGDAVFDQDKIIVNSVRGRLGGGPLSASGQIRILGFSEIPIDIHGQFSDVKLTVPEGFATKGSGIFAIRGSWFPYVIDADYNVESGTIERKATTSSNSAPEVKPSAYLPKFLTAKRFSPVELDLDINLRRDVAVRWQVARTEVRVAVTGGLKVEGPPELPRLTGRVVVARGGRLEFNANNFDILNGTIEYRNAPPTEPHLDVSAESRVIAKVLSVNGRDYEERDYDVNLRVQGTPSEPRVTLTSQPQLPENELISLLTLGFINESQPSETGATDQLGELQNQSYRIGSAMLYEQLGLGREIEKRFGIEVGVDTNYDPVDKASVPVISLKKQWTPKFGTSASRTLGKKTVNNFKAEYRLNRNLSVIGEWEGQEANSSPEATTDNNTEQNLFGVDIEYRVDFK